MYAIESVNLALIQIERTSAQRVIRATWHTFTPLCCFLVPGLHILWRQPRRPLRLALDDCTPGPSKSFTANADSVPFGLSLAKHQVKKPIVRVHDQCPSWFVGVI